MIYGESIHRAIQAVIHQTEVLEGIKDRDTIAQAFDEWSERCVVTKITDIYLKNELPDINHKSDSPIKSYLDYGILQGIWVVCADYDRDVDTYYWCRCWGFALVRECILQCKSGRSSLIQRVKV